MGVAAGGPETCRLLTERVWVWVWVSPTSRRRRRWRRWLAMAAEKAMEARDKAKKSQSKKKGLKQKKKTLGSARPESFA